MVSRQSLDQGGRLQNSLLVENLQSVNRMDGCGWRLPLCLLLERIGGDFTLSTLQEGIDMADMPEVGQQAPDFSVPSLNSEAVKLSDFNSVRWLGALAVAGSGEVA